VPRKFFRKYLPDPDTVRSSRLVKPFGSLLQHPNLWCLNRRSVAGAVAIGLFCGLIPGPLQMLGALLFAIPLRRNIPVALLVTLYTNPLTIVPLYLLAYGYGRLILWETVDPGPIVHFEMDWSAFGDSMHRLLLWMLALGKPLGIGLVALGLTLAILGYVTVYVAWRMYVVGAWRARGKRRKARGA
jgi:uncharacterized protein (DUF2062 family)